MAASTTALAHQHACFSESTPAAPKDRSTALSRDAAMACGCHPGLSCLSQGIPVVGAILVSPGLDRCLLVRGWGTQGSWGFPRGKINENEPDAACAVREVRVTLRICAL